MLKKMFVKNINGINGKVEIDLSPGNFTYKPNMIDCSGYVNPIAIYGLNGSGKTTLLNVFRDLHIILTSSSEKILLFTPYIGENNSIDNESELVLIFSFKGIEFKYTIRVNSLNNFISFEELITNDLILRREKNNFELFISNIKIDKYGSSTIGINYSILRQFGFEQYSPDDKMFLIKSAYNYLSSISHISISGHITSTITDITDIKTLMVSKSNEVKKQLSSYGSFPIYDLAIKEQIHQEGVKNPPLLYFCREGEKTYFHESLMSNGMISLSKLLTILVSQEEDTLLVIDGIENNLHPFIAKKFIEELNKNYKIQIIFASHNTSFLQILRPDQIFISNWNKKSLQAEYNKLSTTFPNIREVNNIEKMYFNGSFNLMNEDK